MEALVQSVAYSQFLESYKVTMDAMAKSFRVSVNFLDMKLFAVHHC